MTVKVLKMVRKLVVFSLPLVCIIACENDLNSIDAAFIDNKNFETIDSIYAVGFSTEILDKVETYSSEFVSNGFDANRYLLGVYKDLNFGTMKASFVSQLKLPSTVTVYQNVIEPDTLLISSMDGVMLYIPLEKLSRTPGGDIKSSYVLDSVSGVFGEFNRDTEKYGAFDVEVKELNTFLNILSSDDAYERNNFFTNATYSEGEELASISNFAPSYADTVSVIERKINGVTYLKDSISLENNAPRIAIPLSSSFFKTKILDLLNKSGETRATELSAQNQFSRYFKGLSVKAVSSDAASMSLLKLSDAYVEMYYTNVLKSISENKDLDTISESKKFVLGDIKAAVHEHDGLRGSDSDNIYIQGATGSEGVIDLFQDLEELTSLRSVVNEKGAIINEASLKFYVDEVSVNAVQRLFIYKKTNDGNFQLDDYISASNTSGAQGYLKQEEGDNGRYYYEFRITDYIKNLLEDGNTANADALGLKVFTEGDLPTAVSDTIISTTSWDPRGVVLYGGNTSLNHDLLTKEELDEQDPDRVVLKVNYSKIK